MKILIVAMFFALTTTSAMAIDWPVSLNDAKFVGQNLTVNQIIADSSYSLERQSNTGPSASLTTPFQLAAFIYANSKATYVNPTSSDFAELQKDNTLDITARAFSTVLSINDDMVVVIKQNDKVISAVSKSRPHQDVTEFPEVGYRTNKTFKFLLASLNLKQLFTVVIANVVTNGNTNKSEATWNLDPTKIR